MKTAATLPEEFLSLGYFRPADETALQNELRAGLGRTQRTTLAYLMECAFAADLPGYRRILAYQGDPLDLARDFAYKAALCRLITPAELGRLQDTLTGMDELLPLLRLWAQTRTAIRGREKAEAAAAQLPKHIKSAA